MKNDEMNFMYILEYLPLNQYWIFSYFLISVSALAPEIWYWSGCIGALDYMLFSTVLNIQALPVLTFKPCMSLLCIFYVDVYLLHTARWPGPSCKRDDVSRETSCLNKSYIKIHKRVQFGGSQIGISMKCVVYV